MAIEMSIDELKEWAKIPNQGCISRAVLKLIHDYRSLQNQVVWFARRIESDARLLAAKVEVQYDGGRPAAETPDERERTEGLGEEPRTREPG